MGAIYFLERPAVILESLAKTREVPQHVVDGMNDAAIVHDLTNKLNAAIELQRDDILPETQRIKEAISDITKTDIDKMRGQMEQLKTDSQKRAKKQKVVPTEMKKDPRPQNKQNAMERARVQAINARKFRQTNTNYRDKINKIIEMFKTVKTSTMSPDTGLPPTSDFQKELWMKSFWTCLK